jgi:hypothetical protein
VTSRERLAGGDEFWKKKEVLWGEEKAILVAR